MKSKFTSSEERVIRAMHKLGRLATTNEIADWANGMSWNTAYTILKELVTKDVVERYKKRGSSRVYWDLMY